MDKPRLYVLMTWDEDGTDTSVFFKREEALEEWERSTAPNKVVGEIEEYKSFGQGPHTDWFGIDVIESKTEY